MARAGELENADRKERGGAMNVDNDIPAGIGKPATRALEGVGIRKLHQLEKVTEAELLSLHGFGPKALLILRETLAAEGRSFKKSNK